MATKFGRILTSLEQLPVINLLDPLITLSCKMTWPAKTIVYLYHSVYGHQSWQDAVLSWETSAFKFTRPFGEWSRNITWQIKIIYIISITTVSLATKLTRLETYVDGSYHIVIWTLIRWFYSDNVTIWKICLSTFTRVMTTKLGARLWLQGGVLACKCLIHHQLLTVIGRRWRKIKWHAFKKEESSYLRNFYGRFSEECHLT